MAGWIRQPVEFQGREMDRPNRRGGRSARIVLSNGLRIFRSVGHLAHHESRTSKESKRLFSCGIRLSVRIDDCHPPLVQDGVLGLRLGAERTKQHEEYGL